MKLGKTALAILILAMILRLVLVYHATWYPKSDTRDYHKFAYNLAEHNSYQQLYQGETDEYQDLTLYAYRMPGYPAFLAAVYSVFEWRPIYAYLANVVCDMLAALFLFLIGRRALGHRPALLALGLFVPHVLWTPNLMTESLFTMLFIGITGLLVYEVPSRSWVHALGVGAVLAAAIFVRPIAVSLIPIMLYETTRSRHGVRRSAALLLPLLLAIGAWAYRNYRIFGQLVFLSTNLGPHNAESFGLDRKDIVLQLRDRGRNMAQINRALIARIVGMLQESPLAAVGLYLRRIVALFSLEPAWEVRSLLWERTFAGPNGSPIINEFFHALYAQYYVTYPLALLGGVVLTIRSAWPRVLWAVPLSYVLLHALVSEGNIRFAAPLYPFLCLFTGYVLYEAGVYLHNRPSQSALLGQPST